MWNGVDNIMIYKDKKIMTVIALVGMVSMLWLSYKCETVGYRVFGIIVVILTSILYLFGIFEYFSIDDEKITHVRNFRTERDIIYWKDVTIVTVLPYKWIKGITLRSGIAGTYDIVISNSIKGYRDMVRIVYEKTKDNPDVFIDIRVKELLDKWNK